MKEMVKSILSVKLKDSEDVVKDAAIIDGTGAEDDRGLDMAVFSVT